MALKTWLRPLTLRCALNLQRAARSARPAWLKKRQLLLELLESRDLPSVTVQPTFILNPQAGGANPLQAQAPAGYTPAQLRTAYGLNGIGDGTGTTIAIVDAYSDPNVAADLDVFDQQFGLTASGPTLYQQYGAASTFLKVVNETGGSKLPAGNTGWAEEIALDVEWAHSIAPGARILLVEAKSSSNSDLDEAVSYAADQTGVAVVSMSWGGSESSGEKNDDSVFTTPKGHAGVTFVASSGDAGAPPSYPAVSPNVLAVGGTTLNLNPSGSVASESGWSGSGGGISAYESQPSYQKGVVTQSTTKRTNPDVAYDADPNTGFPVYNSYSFSVSEAWEEFGGTSCGAPQWSGLIAIADQMRSSIGLTSLDGPSQTLPMLYGLPQSDFHDITTGTSTGTPNYSAGTGYDLVTGRGTPIAVDIVAGLLGSTSTSTFATHFSVSASPSSINAGSTVTVTVTALTSTNTTLTTYNGTVQFSSSDSQAVLPAATTLTRGVGTFTVTLKSEGSQSIVVADAANSYIAGTATVTVAPLVANSVVFSQQPQTVTPGATMTPAVTADIVDIYGNVITSDNTDQVTLALGNNPGAGTLSGGGPVTVTGGVATFSNLSINNAGNGYTLTASSGSLGGATSASFNVVVPLSPTGTTPAQIRTAYGLNDIGDGTGTTIAIVDPYSDPNVVPDLDVFDQEFGLTASGPSLYQQYGAASSFMKVVNQTGGSNLPAGNTSWAPQTALDVEWAHAIAPGAKILLVATNSNGYNDLLAGVAYAADQPGVVVVSMSWDSAEWSTESGYDSYFTTPRGHAGVTFVASSGDSAAPPQFPAVSPNVLSVGGTVVDLSASGSIVSETGWEYSSGGISAYERQPSYQKGVVTQSTTMRTNPDVAYAASPAFPVYNSYSNPIYAAWATFGGTSNGAPQWSGIVAIADQARIGDGLSSLDGPSQTLPMLYGLAQSDFNDITSGTSVGTPNYSAGPGYDLVTGRGTPIGPSIVAGLLGSSKASPFATHFSVTASPSSINAGSTVTVTVTALTSTNTTLTSYSGTVQFSSSDPQALLPAATTLSKGVGTFTVTLKSAGSQSITVTDALNSYIAGTAKVTVAPLAANGVAFVQQPQTVAPGAVMTPAVTVAIVDSYGNVETGDNTDQVTLALGANPGGGTLSGVVTATVANGVATFSNLSINAVGYGYTLTASSGSLLGATSAGFNVAVPVNFVQAPGSPIALGNEGGYLVVGDFNGDGNLDLATQVVDLPNSSINIFLGNGDGTFAAGQVIPVGYVESLAEGDFTNNGILDLAYTNEKTDTLNILLGNGNGTFAPGPIYPLPGTSIAGYFGLTAASVTNDGNTDLIVTDGSNPSGNELVFSAAVFLGNGNGTFQAPISSLIADTPSPYTTFTTQGGATVADLIPGGNPDLVVANGSASGPAVIVLLGNGNGTFGAPINVGVAGGIGSQEANVAVGDFNGDGNPDLAVENSGAMSVSVMLGNGNGTFSPAVNYPVGAANPRDVVAVDFNGNGKLDLAVTTDSPQTDTVSILLGNGNGTFGSPQTYAVGGVAESLPWGLAVADLTSNGLPDLVIDNRNSGNINILLQDPPGNTPATVQAGPANNVTPLGQGGGLTNNAAPAAPPAGGGQSAGPSAAAAACAPGATPTTATWPAMTLPPPTDPWWTLAADADLWFDVLGTDNPLAMERT